MKKHFFLILLLGFVFGHTFGQTILLNESFETWPAPGWETYELGSAGGWTQELNFGYTGDHCATHNNSVTSADNWLVSPQIYIDNNFYQLTFQDFTSNYEVYIMISTGSGDPSDGDFEEIAVSTPSGWWQPESHDLSEYEGEYIYIAFHTSGDYIGWCIDDVVIAPSSYIDAALTEIVSPEGYSTNTGIEDIIVNIKNIGSTPLTDFNINWSVNGVAQGVFNGTGYNIQQEEELNITVGQYEFTDGLYQIEAEIIATDDIDSSNNICIGEYSVNMGYDLALERIMPDNNYPHAGFRDIIVQIKNNAVTTLNDFDVEYSINGVAQPSYSVSGLGLQENDTTFIVIGSYDFANGVYDIEVNIPLAYDLNIENNSKNVTYAVGNLYEDFSGEFHPLLWKLYYADWGRWIPQNNDPSNYHAGMIAVTNVFGTVSDTMFSPRLNIQEGDVFSLKACKPMVRPANLSIVWKDESTGQIHTIEEPFSTSILWQEYSFDISEAAGINRIGVVASVYSEDGYVNVDDLTSTASIHLLDNDLLIKDFEAENMPFVGEEQVFNCRVINVGNNSIDGSSYTINLKDEMGATLTMIPGVNLNSFDEHYFEMTYTFTDISCKGVYAELSYLDDQDIENNVSLKEQICPIPEISVFNTIGEPEMPTLYAPISEGVDPTWGDDDFSQGLFYNEEVGTPGYIYGVKYYYQNYSFYENDVPVEVWIAETNQSDLLNGWLSTHQFNKVFEDTVRLKPTYIEYGVTPPLDSYNYIYIPFDEPYLYDGTQNIVMQFFNHDNGFPPTNTAFYVASDDNARIIGAMDFWDINPEDPPLYGYNTFAAVSYCEFVITPENSGVISGVVYDENNTPMPNATILIDGTATTVETNANGEYTLPSILYGQYSVTASAFGYMDSTQTVDVNQTNQIVDFNLQLRPKISITGNVVGSNEPSSPLEYVQVTLNGYDVYYSTSDDNGNFELVDVYGFFDYNLKLELLGYETYQNVINVEDNNIDLGTIVLNEQHLAAYNVKAEEVGSNASVNWGTPISGIYDTIVLDWYHALGGYANDPYENVWLGNKYSTFETITITDVNLFWSAATGGVSDSVTIEIFNSEGNLILTSEKFSSAFDQWMTIDIPNITVCEDYYIMVHWDGLAETTDFLGCNQMGWDETNDFAYIKYPNEEFELVSDYLGFPHASYTFVIRPCVVSGSSKDEQKEVLSYNIYRGLADDLSNVNTWEIINSEPILSTEYLDFNWSDAEFMQQYRFAVEPVYAEGEAEKTLSNILINTVSSISKFETGSNINIFPNPVANNINIENMSQGNVSIFNFWGQLVYENNCSCDALNIDMKKYSAGKYLVRIQETNRTQSFIIEVVK